MGKSKSLGSIIQTIEQLCEYLIDCGWYLCIFHIMLMVMYWGILRATRRVLIYLEQAYHLPFFDFIIGSDWDIQILFVLFLGLFFYGFHTGFKVYLQRHTRAEASQNDIY